MKPLSVNDRPVLDVLDGPRYAVIRDSSTLVHAVQANSFATRLRGLLWRAPLKQDEALYLSPCRDVHSFFMRCSIDVVFLDGQQIVVKVVRLAPARLAWCRSAESVLELRSGALERLQIIVGQSLSLECVS